MYVLFFIYNITIKHQFLSENCIAKKQAEMLSTEVLISSFEDGEQKCFKVLRLWNWKLLGHQVWGKYILSSPL